MTTKEDVLFVPQFASGLLEPTEGHCIADVAVPLMLIRHTAELPDVAEMLPAVEAMRGEVRNHAKTGERLVHMVEMVDKGALVGIVFYLKDKGAEVYGESMNDPEVTVKVALDPRGLLLGQVDAADEDQGLTLFSTRLVDVRGRTTTLYALWYPQLGQLRWEWLIEGEQMEGVTFSMSQAAQIAGFITLLRMASDANDWIWTD